METRCCSTSPEQSHSLLVSPSSLLRQTLLRVRLLTNFTLILASPFWLRKEWSTDLLTLLVEEPLYQAPLAVRSNSAACQEISWAWNRCAFTLGSYQATCMQTGFLKEVAKGLLWTFEDPLHMSTCDSGLDSSIGVVEGISLHGRPLFCGMQSFSCICGGGWSYLTLLLRAIEPPSLVGADLAAIRIISIKFSSTKRHVHRESSSHQNETWSCLQVSMDPERLVSYWFLLWPKGLGSYMASPIVFSIHEDGSLTLSLLFLTLWLRPRTSHSMAIGSRSSQSLP